MEWWEEARATRSGDPEYATGQEGGSRRCEYWMTLVVRLVLLRSRRGFGGRCGNRSGSHYPILERQIEQRIGVHTSAVKFDAPVEMRAGGAAGRSHLADDLTSRDQVSVFDQDFR